VAGNVLAAAARQSLRMLVWQLACLAVVAGALAMLFGARAGWSALIGGGIGSLWTVYMALILFKHSLTHGVRMSAATFLFGWLMKVALTVGLLVVAFRSGRVSGLPLLAGLGTALAAYWGWLSFRMGNGVTSDGK
jgi:F0F1-type ATP synthase assembly protein I